MLNKIGLYAAEVEATKGTAATIVVADGVLCNEPSIKPSANMDPLNAVRDDAMPLAPIAGGQTCTVSAGLWLKGSGTAGTKTDVICDHLEACGVDMTADTGYAVRGALSSNLSSVDGITCKEFRDGKYVTAKGVCGNMVFTLEAGKKCIAAFEGQGPFEASGDTAVLAAPANSPIPPVFINGDTVLLEHHATTEDDADGDGELLRGTAGTGIRLCKTIAQGTTTQKVWGVAVRIKKIGTPATETNGTYITIEGDDEGDPDETPITNGTSEKKLATTFTDTDWEWEIFEMGSYGNRPSMTASTTWHVCLQGDAALADTNCLSIDTDVVVEGAQNSQEQAGAEGDYSAISLENLSMYILVAPDVENYFPGAEINLNNEVALRTDPTATQGVRFADINGRGDGTTATLAPLEKLDASQNFWTEHVAGTDMFYRAVLGDDAGNIVEWNFLHCKIKEATPWDDRDGRTTHPVVVQVEKSADVEINFK